MLGSAHLKETTMTTITLTAKARRPSVALAVVNFIAELRDGAREGLEIEARYDAL